LFTKPNYRLELKSSTLNISLPPRSKLTGFREFTTQIMKNITASNVDAYLDELDSYEIPIIDPADLERETIYKKTNRESAKAAKRTRFYCRGCDSQMVSPSQRCPQCGRRENRKKIRD
jgi:hypothetical protein